MALEPGAALLSRQPPQLVDEARLADAGLAGDEEQAALAAAQPLDGLQAGSELGLAADHRRRPGRAGALGRGVRLASEPRRHRSGLALQRERGERLIGEGGRRQPLRQRADDHAHRRRGRLEAGGRVDGVAGEEAAAGGRIDVEAHQRLSGVDAAARLQRGAVGAGHALDGLQ